MQEKSIKKRFDFIILLREKEFSVHTRMSFMLHVANLENQDEGDLIIKESWEMVENGATEQEFIDFLQTKYGLKHILDMTQEEIDTTQEMINQWGAKRNKVK